MQTLKAFTDKRGGDAAVAAEAFAHGGELVSDFFTAWNAAELPDSGAFAYPPLLAVGGGHPNSGLNAFVIYAKRPFGFEIIDIHVGNGDLGDGVYDDQMIIVEHQLRSHPNQEDNGSEGCTCSQLQPVNCIFNGIEDHLGHEEAIENQSNKRPGKVALGSKDVSVIHASIIAGNAAVQEGK